MANTIKLGNGNWATKEGSLLAYNDENNNFKPLPFTTTRASSATVVNKQGLIETVGSGIPRIDFSDDSDGALLLEPTATNGVTYSEDFSNSSWAVFDATKAPNSITDPSGNLTGCRVTALAGSNKVFQKVVSHTADPTNARTFTGSFYIKSPNTTSCKLRVGSTTNQLVLTISDQWQRFDYQYSLGATFTAVRLGIDIDVEGDIIDVAFGQVEENSYATSYIKTVGTAQTRVADTASGSGNSTVINSTEGVLYAEIKGLADDSTIREIAISDGTNNNRIELRFADLNSEIDLVVRSIDSSVQANFGTTSYDVTNFNKVAVRYKLNDVSLWVNGVKINTDTSAIMPINLSELAFDSGAGANDFYGKTKSVQVYTTALSDAELTSLTTI